MSRSRPCFLLPWRLFAAWVVALMFGDPCRAHDPGISTVQIEISGTRLEILNGFAPADARHLVDRPGEDSSDLIFDVVRDRYVVVAPKVWEVLLDGVPAVASASSAELLPEDNLSLRIVYQLPASAGQLTLRATRLASLPVGHRQFLIVADARGSTIGKKLLSSKDPALELTLTPVTATSAMAGAEPSTPPGFLTLGVEHIWTGYDHLAFLFGLLLVCRSFASVAAVVSCFTAAHSLTLAAATLHWVQVPARWVEPLIAVSIVFVGVENLWRRGESPPYRWLLTFVFGLIHGFGFASVLSDLGVGAAGTSILGPLLLFNAGVEMGQLVVAAIVLPLIWCLRRRAWFLNWGVTALSAGTALAGAYWLVERLWAS